MDSFNKVISFVLGLVVVLVFFAVATGKINLRSKSISAIKTSPSPTPITTQKNNDGFFAFLKPKSPTLTPVPTKTISSITINTKDNKVYKLDTVQVVQNQNVKSIPSTGLPTVFIPILLSGLTGGAFLRKAGRK
jgi:hypothetical protein